MAPRVHCGAIVYLTRMGQLKLQGDAGVDGLFSAAVGARRSRTSKYTDTGIVVVVKAELVLPVAIGNPGCKELRVLRPPYRLAGIKGQTDRFAVQLGLGPGAVGKIAIALRPVNAGATADGEILQVLGQEAEVHVIVDFQIPSGFEIRVAVNEARRAGNARTKQTALVECAVAELLVGHRRYVDIAFVWKIEGKLEACDEVTLCGS